MYYRRTDGRVPLRQQDSAFITVDQNQRFQQVVDTLFSPKLGIQYKLI